jgi:hypothetical protein
LVGVPQGSPISSLCFSLFIDDMTDVLEFSKFHMYADDLQIYHSRPKDLLSDCIREVNSDLRKIFEWSRANFLRFNPAKSILLPIYRGHLLSPLFVENFILFVF